jgi:hypothetical protein
MANRTFQLISLIGWLSAAAWIVTAPGCAGAVEDDTAAEACPDSLWHYQVRYADGTVDAGDVCAAAQDLAVGSRLISVDVAEVDALGRETRAVRVDGQSAPVMVPTCGLAPTSSWLVVEGERTLLTVWCSDDWRAR